jgi:xylulokinase
LWCDKRSDEQCQELRRTEEAEQWQIITANPINPAWTSFKVRWIKQHQPEIYEQTHWFLTPKDFINYRLTGVAATDPSEASGMFLMDAARGEYSGTVAEALELDLDRFPPIRPSHQVIGRVGQEAAEETGLPVGTPVVAGGGDFPVSLLGLGVVDEGVGGNVTGSSNLISVHSSKPLVHGAIQNLRAVAEGWIPFAIQDCGGLSMKWCKEWLASTGATDVSYDKLIEMAERIPPGSDGLQFYPYMLGERRGENTAARGAYIGITLNHGAGHFVRATMEGVALAMALSIALIEELGAPMKRIRCVGGGTRNVLWNQIKADVVGRALELTGEPEAGLRGAALLAAAGVGLISNLAEAARQGSPSQMVSPDPTATEAYRASRTQFQRLYDRLLGFWQSETSITGATSRKES